MVEQNRILLKQCAQMLRKNSTDAENHLWYYLRAHRLGYKFKRQVPIGQYIVDFICLQKKLIIELDGGQHLVNQYYDNKRTHNLSMRGFRVLRYWNHDVLNDTENVLTDILNVLNFNSSS